MLHVDIINSNYILCSVLVNIAMVVQIFKSARYAISRIKSDSVVLVGGFGLCGIPSTLLKALAQNKEVKGLQIVSNTAGTDEHGLGMLVNAGKVKKVTSSYIGENLALENEYLSGCIDLELVPQGTLAEKLRAGGAGIPAFYTRTGINTYVQSGKMEIHHAVNALFSKPKETRTINGKSYILETAINGDVALLHAHMADKQGNLRFRYSARNFNPLVAQAAKYTIVEYETLVDQIAPDKIHLPGIYVDALVPSGSSQKFIERTVLSRELLNKANPNRIKIAQRVAEEFKEGMHINLGIGIPTLATHFVPNGMGVNIQSENGIIGMGDYPKSIDDCDPDIIDAGKEAVTLKIGASIVDSADAFSMIRGGHLDLTVLGAFQVSQTGDLANWIVPGKMVKGMGGAMDLVSSGKTKVIAAFEHTDYSGTPKIVQECSLPLTGKSCVNRIITEMAVFDVIPEGQGLVLVQLAKDISLEQVCKKTGCSFEISPKLLEPF